ncbi:DUF4347 domain-containing protein [Pseudomonas sp. WOUb67]|uniref:DUF4347 domain-containing protein n=1 Tax=Pseudomonas sp. WOUb67 TaxID=3161136 RepID=UPI003CFA93EA
MKFIERFSRKASVGTVAAGDGQPPLLMALEPRIMFDASVGVVAQDAAQATAEPAKDSTSNDQTSQQDSQASASADSRSAQNDQRHEVVFVDGQVANVGELLEGLSGKAEVVILDPNKDGLQQMADYLKGREGLDAIHLLSHGADGSVQTGNLWLATNNLGEHREALQSIGAALKADGDLMLYGCNVGESGQGQAFLDQLALITGADVAASADDTGAASLGGNWALERSSGVIETASLGTQLEGYDGLLAATFTGGANPTAPTLLSGQLPRFVVGDFNNDGRSDILYQIGANGSAWKFAAGNADGTFSIVDQIASPFANVTLIDAASNGTNYYAADFDKDGDIDLLGVTVTSGPAYLYRNVNGVFTREVAAGFNGTQYGVRLVVGDFNGDGAADILYQPGTVDSANAWRYALNNGDGTFTDMVQSASPFAAFTLAAYSTFNYKVIDFDGDGDLDILYQLNNSTGALYLNNGNNTFSQGSTAGFPVPVFAPRTLWGDFDGDGDADVFWQVGANGTDWNYGTNNGDGTFTIVTRANSPFAGLNMTDYGVNNFRIGDFDGDGDIDVVGSSPVSTAFVYYQAGTPPTLVSATPADDSLNVSPSANIVLTFSQSVTKGTGNIHIVRTSDNQVVQTILASSSQVTGSGTTWTIDPSDLAQGTAYAVRIDSKAFANADGKVFKGISNNTTLNFTTSTVQAPVIGNVNGDTVTYVEDSAYVLLDAGANATVSDADSANFSGGKLIVQITAGGTVGEDVLFIRDQIAGANQIILSGAAIMYNGLVIGTFTGGSNGNPLVVTFTNNANAITVAALVQNLAYRNSNTVEPSTASRSVSVSMDDGAGGSSAISVVSVAVQAVNDAPVVNLAATNPTYTENASAVQLFSGATVNTVESGQKVTQMTFTVTTVFNGAAEKLVIDGSDVTLTNGTSVVTTNNGTVVTVSVTSGTASVTLSSSAGLDVATAQTILNTMAYRNDSDSPNTTNRVVTLSTVSDNGGSANGGLPTLAVGIFSTVTVVGINDAPVLSGGPYSFPSTNEDTTSTGTRVSTLLTNYTMVDADVGALRGIAVITKSGNGIWQYSTDNATWTDFGAVSSTSALLLASTTYIRYVPDAANGETASLSFRGWDQTTGTASVNGIRGTSDTSSNGGTTAFSTGTAVANLTVTSVNDAPVMTPVSPVLNGISETALNNGGSTVLSLLGGVTDVDTSAVKGMAVTGLTATYGTWQFSLDAGSTWSDVGVVSTSAALLLTAQNLVRFVPDGIHGETATITYKAWDQSSNPGLQGFKLNITTAGGTSAYSTGADTASVVVTAVNDAPVVTVSGGTASWSEGNNVASTPVLVDPGLTLSDPDGPNPISAAARMLTYYSAQDSLSFVNDGLTMGNIIGTWTVGTGTLTLTSAGNQATVEQFQAALRAVTYTNASETPNTTIRTVGFTVTDGEGAQSALVARDITITAVNDSPTISAVASLPITEDTPTALGQITFSDVDSTLGVVTFSVGSGTFSATGFGGVAVGGTATALTLSGTLANINNFIAGNRLVYTPAANASGDVTLTINVNTSSVSDATTTVTLQVVAVNDAPVVTVPPSITVTEDVSSVISGISFTDVDAGANTVTATFSVPSGSLSATGGMGVTVTGSDTGELTLSGSLADINFFIAANGLTFKTAQDATTSVTLTVTLNDKGFSGTGGEQTDTKTVTLNVSAVNDAPVNNVPGTQTASQNIALGFNTANGNAISITDVDAGNGLMTVILMASNGQLSLGSLTGISLVIGTGLNDTVMAFEGTRADINAALQTLSFTPGSNYIGGASLTIQTFDNGNSGSGGPLTDFDTIVINVIPVNPVVTSVAAQGLDRAVKVGDEVLISMVWDQVVNVDLTSGSPSLLLETGLIDRNATYVSGSGSNTLVFKYTVQAGDISADLDFQSTAALQMNGAVISNNTSDLAVLTLPTVGGADSLGGRSNIVVDGVVPVVASVSAPSDGTYIIGQNLDFTVNFSENVQVDTTGGVPRIAVTLDTGGTVYADYVAGSGGSALVFRLTVASGQLDSNGVTLGGSVQLNGGSIRDSAGNDTVVTLNSVASTANVHVDGVVPVVASVTAPLDGNYKAGDVLTFTVNASEALQTGALAPRLVLDVGGVTRYATYVSGSGGAALVFQYTVQVGDNDGDGIAVNSLDLRGEQLTDLAGNDLNLTLNSVGSTAGVVVDTTAPSAGSIVRIDASPNTGSSVSYTVTFDEDVSGVDASDFNLVFGGTAGGSISSVTAVDGRTYTVVVAGLSGSGSLRLDLNNSGTGIVDHAGNAVVGGLSGATYSIDRVAPSVTSVAVPSNGTYLAGQNLDFTVHLDEAVQLDTSNGAPRIAVTLDDGTVAYATYLSGAGTDALVFRMTVANGQLDSDGVALGGSIQLNGATLRDAAGNDVNLPLNNVASTAGVQVDAVVPVIESVTVPANGNYKAGDVLTFTVNASEALQTGALAPRLVLDVGGVTRYATYVSGSGGAALVFQYTVQVGDNDGDGIAVNSLDLRGEQLTDLAGNDLNLTLNSVGSTAGVVVDTTAPSVGSIVRIDASPNTSSSVSYTVTFDEDVSGVDASDFNLVFGGTAGGSISSVTAVDGRTYTVVVAGLSGSGSLRLDLNNSGTGIVDHAGNAVVGGLSGATYSIDRVAPSVSSVDAPSNGTYRAGQNLDFTVHLDEAVQLDTRNGTPRIAVTLDDGTVTYATYLSGAGTNALVFRMTVANGQLDSDGVALGGSIQLNGATLRDTAGNDVNLALNNVASTAGVQVDAVVPVIESVTVPANGNYKAGDVLTFTVNASEALQTGALAPRLVLDVGGVTRYATYVSGSGGAALVFQYTVQAGDNDGDGIAVNSLDLRGEQLTDLAGNSLNLTLNGMGSTAGVMVDTVAPSAGSIVRIDASPNTGSSVSYTVTFDEDVSGVDASDFNLVFGGTAGGSISSVTAVDGRTYTVVVAGLSGSGSLRLDLNNSGTGIVDHAGNAVVGGLSGATYSIDRVAPSVTSVAVPSNGTYLAGQNLDFTVHLDEAVQLDTSNGTPRIAVTLDDGTVAYATYLAGAGTDALVFRMTVANGQLDSDGVALGGSIQLNGATLRDAAGNDVNLALNNVASTAGVQVDAVVPVIESVTVPANGNYKAGDVLTFTVNASEALQTGALAPRLVLDVGGVTRYATYVSGSGGAALVFQYTVQAGDNDGDGIAVNSLDLRGEQLTDLAGNSLNLTLNGMGSTAGVMVDTVAPSAGSIVRIDASPNTGSSVSYTVTFDEDVSGVDASDFNLVFDGTAGGSISSVTAVDGHTYTVIVSGLVGTGSVRLDLKSGTDIADAAGNLVADGRVGASYSIDRDVPSVTSVDVPSNGTYLAGQNLDFTVHLDEAVQLDTRNGTPRIAVTLDDGTVTYATYLSGAGTDALVFRMTVANGQLDSDGVALGGSIQLNGATLRDTAGNDVNLALNNVASTAGVQVDAVVPVIESVTVPANGNYKAGDVLTFTVNASEALQTGALAPRLVLDVGGVTRYATYVSGSGGAALVFQYTVQAGDNDGDGIAVNSLDLRGEQLTDLAGNSLNLTLNGMGSTAGVMVDTVAPSAGSIVRIDASPNTGSSVSYTVTFDEDVSGVDASDFNLVFDGTAGGSISSVTAVDGHTYTVIVSGLVGTGSVRLDLKSGTDIADAAGNLVADGRVGASYSIDRDVPSVTSVDVPSNGTYLAGQNLDFTVHLDEAVQLDTRNGTPRIAVTLDDGTVAYATYLAGAGTDALVFRMTVANGQLDSDGVALGGSIQLNGATLRDAAGNDVNLALNNVASTAGVQVDAVVPVIESVTVPANGNYKAGDVLTFTVNASEALQTGALAPRLVLDVGGVTRYATYVSGSGGAALVFQYTVQAGDNDGDGIAVSSLDLRGEQLTDLAGNDLNLTLNSVGSTAGVVVDTTAPSAGSIVRIDASPNTGSSVSYTVTFDEDVSGVDASDFSLVFGGTAGGSISSVTAVDGHTYTVIVSGLVGTGSVRLDLKSGTDIADAAGNLVADGRVGASYSIDRDVPSVTSVAVPGNGTYIIGQNLDFTVNFSENVQVDTTGGVPRIAVTLDTGGTVYADYVSGSGGSALVFRLTVASGQLDSNGVTLGGSVQLNGGSIRDSVGNDTVVTLNGVASTANVHVDGVVPAVVSVTTPLDGNYKAGDVLTFTVNASEALQTGALVPRLVLDVGGVTRYATYVSGSGGAALVFQYTVQAGDTDGDGIAVSSLDLRGEQLTDLAGNDLNLTLNSVGSTAGVVVDTTAPSAGSIVRIDASPNTGSSVSYTVTFDEDVSGVDASDFSLVFGGTAGGSISSVTAVDGHTYTVIVSGLVGTGSVRLDLKSGTDIADAAGNLVADGRVGASYSIDRDVPSVTSVAVPGNGTYIIGQNLDFTVNFSENVQVDTTGGVPRIAVTLDTGGTVYADYVSGSGGSALVFRLTVASGQLDSNGVTLGGSVQLNGGSIRDSVGNDTVVTLNGVASTANVHVDGVVPAVVSVTTPLDGNYKAGDVLTFTVNASEALQTGALVPRLVLDVGGVTRYATYVSGSGGAALVFQYTVQAGDTDGDGIAVSSLDLRGEQLTDLAGNDLNLTLNSVGSTAGVVVDTTAPSAGSIVRIDASPNTGSSVSYTVTFDEDVSGVDASDFSLVFGGTAGGSISSVTAVDGRTYTVVVAGLSGSGSLRLDLNNSGTGIVDHAGNAVVGGLSGATYSIDRVAPSVTSVDAPGNGTYRAGQHLDFTVHLDEAVQLDTRNGTPRIAVTLDDGTVAYATYLSGAGSNALVFRMTVANGQLDSDGITLGSSIQLNGATMRDSTGNNANTALNGVDDTRQVRIDALVPSVTTVGLPAAGAYNAGDVLRFTVHASENVIVDSGAGTPRIALDINGVTRYASYVSGSVSNALVFEYTVQSSNNANGITLGANIDLNGATLRDAAGNEMNLALNVPGLNGGIVIDTHAPQVRAIANVDITPTNASSVRYTVTFSEGVSGVDIGDFSLAFTGSAAGRIVSLQRVDGSTYTVIVDSLTGAGNVRLDLNANGSGIVDVAGNPLAAGLQGNNYVIDRVAPSVSSVGVPASGTYVAGQTLDFIVNTDEAVVVDSGDGNPRLAITLDNGRMVYADYVSSSGGTGLLFRLSITSGMAGNSTFAVAQAIDLNGGSMRDARGNDANTGLNNVGDTRGILIDAKAPRPSSIVLDGPVLPTDRTLSFTLSFDEAVSGVDTRDFSVLGTGSASGVVQTVQQIGAGTYRIVVGDLRGQGSVSLSLNALNSGIQDGAGNALAVSLASQVQTLQTQDAGDLHYRLNPPQTTGAPQVALTQPQIPGFVANASGSPMVIPSLFDIRTVGGDLQPLGTIFLGDGSSAPSFIAQVFGSSDAGLGGHSGFLGFGGGDGGVFGSSTFAAVFSREVPGVSEMSVFNGSQWKQSDLNQGLRGVFGAPTFGQQLQQFNEADQRHVRELAKALAQPTEIGKRA